MKTTLRFSLLIPLLCSLALSTHAARTDQPNGLGVFTSLDGVAKTAVLAPGAVLSVHVMTDHVGLFSGDALGGAQFRVEVDPRLVVLSKTPAPGASVSLEVAPDEWLLGFGDCQPTGSQPIQLMTYTLFLPPETVDTADLRIQLSDLSDQPMGWTRCTGNQLRRLYPSGGASLNPSSPSIVHLSGTPRVLVQGRDLSLAWESFGASAATLDGAPVTPTASQVLRQPLSDHSYILQADGGPTAQFDVEVIQEPRISTFIAELIGSPDGVNPVRLSWEVFGADDITIEGIGSGQPALGSARVALDQDVQWVMQAQNEWGISGDVAVLGDVNELPPVIIAFVAEPALFHTGDDVEISWSVWNADAVSIDPLFGSVDPTGGSSIIQPTDDLSLTLTASNAFGSTTRTIDVVLSPPSIALFSALPSEIHPGGEVTLQWDVLGATTLEISPDIGPLLSPSGSTTYVPTTSSVEFVLSATNLKGTVSASRTVTWVAPTVALGASTLTPYGGADFDLLVEISGADSANLAPLGPIDPIDQIITTQTAVETVYTLSASNAGGTSEASITVSPQPPTIALSADSTEPFGGQEITLQLAIEGATAASLLPGYPELLPQDQSITLTVLDDTIFTLIASNPAGLVQVDLAIDAQPPTVALSSDSQSVYGGEAVQLTAAIQGADGASISPLPGPIDPAGGVFEVVLEQTTIFVLEASNSAGVSQTQLEVTALAPVTSLTANKVNPFANEAVTLSANLAGATSATLEPGFGAIAPGGGNFQLVVEQPTTFTLTGSNPAGSTISELTITPRKPEIVGPVRIVPQDVILGENATIEWNFAGADLVTVEPIGISTPDNQGTVIVSPSATTDYVVTASNAAGSVVVNMTATVRNFRLDLFRIVPNRIALGSSAQIQWSVAGNATVELLGFGPQPLIGNMTVSPTIPTEYTLIVSDGVDTVIETRQLDVYESGHNGLVISTQPDGSGSVLYPVPFQITPIYAVVPDVEVAMAGYEFSLELPPCLVAVGTQYFPAGSINLGSPPNYIVGMGECIYGNQPVALMRVDLFALSDYCSGSITPVAANPSSFSPPTPGFAGCADQLATFSPVGGLLIGSGVAVLQIELGVDARSDGLLNRWRVPHGASSFDALWIERSAGNEPLRMVYQASSAEIEQGSWLDRDALEGVEYRYQVVGLVAGEQQRSSMVVAKRGDRIPRSSELLANVPNPFNPSTRLRFRLVESGDADLTIFDLAGRVVYRRHMAGLSAGEHEHEWRALDAQGRSISSGVYLVQLSTADGVDTRRVALLK